MNSRPTKKQIALIEKWEAQNYLFNLFAAEERPIVKTVLRTVSKSNLSRTVSVYYKEENITHYVALATGYKLVTALGFNAIKLQGCGMDMGFKLVYDLSIGLYCEDKYEHDKAYKLIQKWL